MQFRFRTAKQESADVAAVAAQSGFTYSLNDPGDVLRMPFRLFGGGGDGRRVSDFMLGQHGGQPAELFRLVGRGKGPDHGDGISATSEGPEEMTCALVGIPADFPPISIDRRTGSAVLVARNSSVTHHRARRPVLVHGDAADRRELLAGAPHALRRVRRARAAGRVVELPTACAVKISVWLSTRSAPPRRGRVLSMPSR